MGCIRLLIYSTSLLCSCQLYKFGTLVGDVLKQHGGDEQVVAKGENNELVYIEHHAKSELLVTTYQVPNKQTDGVTFNHLVNT